MRVHLRRARPAGRAAAGAHRAHAGVHVHLRSCGAGCGDAGAAAGGCEGVHCAAAAAGAHGCPPGGRTLQGLPICLPACLHFWPCIWLHHLGQMCHAPCLHESAPECPECVASWALPPGSLCHDQACAMGLPLILPPSPPPAQAASLCQLLVLTDPPTADPPMLSSSCAGPVCACCSGSGWLVLPGTRPHGVQQAAPPPCGGVAAAMVPRQYSSAQHVLHTMHYSWRYLREQLSVPTAPWGGQQEHRCAWRSGTVVRMPGSRGGGSAGALRGVLLTGALAQSCAGVIYYSNICMLSRCRIAVGAGARLVQSARGISTVAGTARAAVMVGPALQGGTGKICCRPKFSTVIFQNGWISDGEGAAGAAAPARAQAPRQ